ncbi:MAG: restriction endonuclease subunit S [bacterium]
MTPKTKQLIISKIPKLRFSGFSGVWEGKKLGDICDVKGGKRIPLGYSLQKENNGLPYITVSDMENGSVSVSKIKFVPESIFEKIKNYTISTNDIFISVAGTLGLVGIIPKELEGASLTENADKLTNLKCNQLFLFHFLNAGSLKKLIENTKTSNAQPKLAIYALKTLDLNIPEISEQQKIAEFLGSTGELINNLKEQKENLESYKRGMMQKIFSQEIRFKEDNGNNFPDWEQKKLGRLTCIYDGTHQTPEYVSEGIPFYSVEHVTANDFSYTKLISKDVFEKENQKVKLEKNDILMTKIGDIGTARLIDWDVGASFYVSLALIKQSKDMSSSFLAQYINSENFQKELWKKTIHVAFPKKINLGEIGECYVIVPSLSEQQKIAEFLTSIDKVIESKQQQITQVEQWKKGLMQGLFV